MGQDIKSVDIKNGGQPTLPEYCRNDMGRLRYLRVTVPGRVCKMLLLISGIFIVAVVVIALNQIFIFWDWGE